MSENLDKLSRFQDSVLSEINGEIDAKLESAEAESGRILKQAGDDYIKASYDRITAETRAIKADCQRKVSKRSFEASREVLVKRNELVEDLFGEIADELHVFSKSAQYEEYLAKAADEANKAAPFYEGVVLYAKASDVQKAEAIAKKYPAITVQAEKSIKIGGFTFFYPEDNRFIDVTLDKRLADEKEAFSARSEMQL